MLNTIIVLNLVVVSRIANIFEYMTNITLTTSIKVLLTVLSTVTNLCTFGYYESVLVIDVCWFVSWPTTTTESRKSKISSDCIGLGLVITTIPDCRG